MNNTDNRAEDESKPKGKKPRKQNWDEQRSQKRGVNSEGGIER